MVDNQHLTPTDRQLLAREVAADRFEVGEDLIEWECDECGERGDVEGVPVVLVREAVKHGWDAAMEYVKQDYIPREEAARIAERPRLQDAMLGLIETSADACEIAAELRSAHVDYQLAQNALDSRRSLHSRLLKTVREIIENNGGLIDSLEGPDTYVMVRREDFNRLNTVCEGNLK